MTKAKIYTRTGDQGTTSLIGGKRVSKASARLEAYGTIDELNSHMGLLASMVTDDAIRKSIEACQCDLFKIGGILATAPGVSWDGLAMDEALLKELEQKIDQAESLLPPLKSFILPGGHPSAAQAHICRTVCRRAERSITALAEEASIDAILLSYINRLSDYLFILARQLNFHAEIEEKKP